MQKRQDIARILAVARSHVSANQVNDVDNVQRDVLSGQPWEIVGMLAAPLAIVGWKIAKRRNEKRRWTENIVAVLLRLYLLLLQVLIV
jgi:hypothetical protein